MDHEGDSNIEQETANFADYHGGYISSLTDNRLQRG